MFVFSSLVPKLVLVPITLLLQSAAPVPPTFAEIKAQLSEYERTAGDARPDPAALGVIGRMVVTRAQASKLPDVWLAACLSGFAPADAGCQGRLLSLLKDSSAPLVLRSRVGATLTRTGDATAAVQYYALVKDLPAKSLATIAPDLTALPDERAIPLLLRVLESADSAHRVAACRQLGRYDSPEVRRGLATAVEAAQVGLPAWNSCTVAQARLRESNAVLKISGATRAMEGSDLLDGSLTMIEIGNPNGEFLLRKVTREAPGVVKLQAAAYLVASDPDYASPFVSRGLQDNDPKVRAQALVLEKAFRRAPSAQVRERLADTDELVRVRAAEAVLDWSNR